ncbi:MAG: acetyl ornithine aminotransferase family protein [Planctomycetota bacterium]|nr:MAG: acetyl ornithine aminotransferase family protein [Planctomycetota bacterium]
MVQRKVPNIQTPLPGPKSKEILAIDEEYISPSYTRGYPLVAKKAEGVVMEDMDGNLFLDMTAGIAVCNTGHCHPQVVKAIQDQASKLIHMSGTDFYYEPQALLAKKLAEIAPISGKKKVFFSNSGAESVEAAFKLARYHTGRPRMISFIGAFHGRTFGALSLTNSKSVQRARFAPLVPGVSHVPYPNPSRCLLHREKSKCLEDCQCLAYLERLFQSTIPPEEVAAVIVEPIQGEGGYIIPPKSFLQKLRDLTRQHGILLIADEVQSGMGRTGKMFACEHFDLEPDIICLAKGIASGMPLGATIARAEVMDWKPGSHASTFGGNPISCRAALATIELLEKELVENSAKVGEFLKAKLSKLQESFSSIQDVRGLGLMIGVEFQNSVNLESIYKKAFEKGLLLLPCGFHSIRFSPALTITEEEAQKAVDIFKETLQDLGLS